MLSVWQCDVFNGCGRDDNEHVDEMMKWVSKCDILDLWNRCNNIISSVSDWCNKSECVCIRSLCCFKSGLLLCMCVCAALVLR